MSPMKFRVAIVGGGLAGLTLAAVLSKFTDDIQVDIYESAGDFTEIGAGIAVWKRTWYIMQQLCFDAELAKLAVRPPSDEPQEGCAFRKGDQFAEAFNFYRMVSPYGSITLHRADLMKVLTDSVSQAANVRAHFSKRMETYKAASSDTSALTLCFFDGTTAEADVIVGADGIWSQTRGTMYRDLAREVREEGAEESAKEADMLKGFVNPTWTGSYAYRALISAERLLETHPGHQAATVPLIYFGKDKHIVSYPISRGKLVNLIGFVTVPNAEGTTYEGDSVVDSTPDEMGQEFKGWEPEVQSLFGCVEKCTRWAISVVRGLPRYVVDNVALIGDAAHAMTTHQGAGAGQAIEDSYILGRVLAHPKTRLQNVAEALKVYERFRLPVASDILERSRTVGMIYEFAHPDFDGAGEDLSEESLKRRGIELRENWSKQWESTPEGVWEEASGILDKFSS